jgi:hypothetical protein
MAAQLSWYLDDHVLYLNLQGIVTPETLSKICDSALEILNKRNRPLHLIIDAQKAASLPTESGPLKNSMTKLLAHKNVGWSVMVTHNLMFQAIMNRMVYGLTDRWGYVGSLSEAADTLRRTNVYLPLIPSTTSNNSIIAQVR